MIKAVLIDIDNTLLDFDKCAAVSMKNAFSAAGLKFEDYMTDVFRSENNRIWNELEENMITKQELRGTRWNRIFSRLNISFDGAVFEKMFEKELSVSHEKVEGADEILNYLSQKYTIYAATNGFTSIQLSRLKKAGFTVYMKGAFISESAGAEKPSADFFRYCFAHMDGFSPAETVIIGDSLNSDMRGGEEFGIKTIWFNLRGEKSDSYSGASVSGLMALSDLL